MMCLACQHAFFGSLAPAEFLAANLLDSGAFCCDAASPHRLDLIQQKPPSQKSVEPLLPCLLALDLQSRGTMQQHDASRCLIDVLPAVTSRADEYLFDIRFAHAQRSHALGKLRLFIRCHLERAHAQA